MNSTEPFQLLEKEAFTFACHPGVPCFTECCRDLRLMLTPYDILRLKNRLGISSGAFLDEYTDLKLGETNGFPAVFLKMETNERRTCPFVTSQGCRVYEDRPGACRIYPVGRGASKNESQGPAREIFFVVREPHCQGFQEPTDWTVEGWSRDQGLERYNYFNDLWMEIITHRGSLGGGEVIPKKMQMFAMASFNLDQFRDFVLGSRFLTLFELPEETGERIKTDDEELLGLACQWLKFALFGEKTMPIRKNND
ncbi:MAG: YkgJ family cysteine cluster protein [Desulfobacteraceae bacterium]|nr:MAG: YkgJ family cysteine cluster protein [Desulfobacteraceae bacterium]